jgi:hypothetical protein
MQAKNISVSPSQQVVRLMYGYLSTQLLYVAAELGLADALADGPSTAETVAEAVRAQPDPMRRVLRGLAADGIVDEYPDGRFALTDVGACLRRDVPGSLHGGIIAHGDLHYRAAAGLLDAMRNGGVAFERVYGADLFEYLSRNPRQGASFQAAMAVRSRQEAIDVIAAYDFAGFEQVVDVGGGPGVLLEAILTSAPRTHGILVDQQAVVEQARRRLEDAGLADRCTFVQGDFFTAIPAGGNAYILSRVIHDWDDEKAVRILANCRTAMGDSGSLLLVEALLPKRAREQPAVIRMDLMMLMHDTGRERNVAEYEQLLRAAGLQLARVVPTASQVGVCVIEATPARPREA